MTKPAASGKSGHRRIWLAIAILAVLLAAAAAWRWTPLADQVDLGKISAWAVSLRHNPARVVIILSAYLIGSLILVPITVLIIATAIVFGPEMGTVYSFVGCLIASAATYGFGYFLGKDFVRKITGPKAQLVERKIGESGIIAVATIRFLPIAPFSVVNIVSGAFKVPLWDYFIGSLLGLAPGIVLINFFEHQFESAIRNPGIGSYALVAGSIVISVLGFLWVRRKFKNNAARISPGGARS